MANNSISFKNIKKQFLTVELEDDTVILIRMPKKGLLDSFFSIQEDLSSINSENSDRVADEVYDICAKVMSCNKAGKEITKEYLEEIFDIEDIIVFFRAYSGFVSALSNAKN